MGAWFSRSKVTVFDVFDLGDEIGSGNFGQVLLCTRRDDPTQAYAVKVVDMESSQAKAMQVYQAARDELDIMKGLNHPNIVKLIQVFQDKRFLYVVMERVKGGELFEALKSELAVIIEQDVARVGLQLMKVCSSSCDTWTMALALTLKELSDYGIILTHESRPVTNIVVLNTPTMDVGDLLPTAVELLEPESGARVSMFSTPASQLALKLLGPEVQERLGWGVSPTFTEELRDNFVERFGETSLTETVPHWWIAAIVQGVYGAYMVHIDLCGPAYGTFCRSRGFTLPGKELTLDSFITPCYLMTPYHRQQTFMVHPENMDYVPNDAKFTSVQEIRHLRCFYQGHPGYVTATPLPSFVDGEKTTSWLRLRSPSEDALDTVQSWKDGLQSIASFFRAQIFKTLEPGTYVEVDDSCENETFKGRLGKVLPDANGEEYLLQLNGLAEPARVHPMELKLYPRYVQYLTLAEMGELVALQLALLQPDQRYMPSELIGYLKRELR